MVKKIKLNCKYYKEIISRFIFVLLYNIIYTRYIWIVYVDNFEITEGTNTDGTEFICTDVLECIPCTINEKEASPNKNTEISKKRKINQKDGQSINRKYINAILFLKLSYNKCHFLLD